MKSHTKTSYSALNFRVAEDSFSRGHDVNALSVVHVLDLERSHTDLRRAWVREKTKTPPVPRARPKSKLSSKNVRLYHAPIGALHYDEILPHENFFCDMSKESTASVTKI